MSVIRIKVFQLGGQHNPIENTDEIYIELEVLEPASEAD